MPEDGSVCAILLCEVKTKSPDGSSPDKATLKTSSSSAYTRIESLSIFQRILGENGRVSVNQIASVKVRKPKFEQIIDGIKGYGHLERGYAMLRLQIKKTVDCVSDFTCQVEGLDSRERDHVTTSHLVQPPRTREEALSGQILSASMTVQMFSLVQQIATKVAQVESSQQSLDIQMKELEHRLEDKMDRGFEKVDDKLCEVELKVSAQGSGSSYGQTMVNVEEIVAATQKIENVLNSTSSAATCEHVIQFLAKNLTTEIGELVSSPEELAEMLGEQLTELTEEFSVMLHSLEASINTSSAALPKFLSNHFENFNSSLFESIIQGESPSNPMTCKKDQVLTIPTYASYPYPVIYPSRGSVVDAPYLCDTTTDGGGWIVIQRRATGDTDFFLDWAEYKEGFGTPDTDYWLGNDNIHALTRTGTWMLRVEVKYDGKSKYAEYKNFSLGDEDSNYELHIGTYSGTAGDSLSRHDGHPFTTKDKDNDDGETRNCASVFEGAWWYINCHDSNLNGRWASTTAHHGLMWRELTGSQSATFSEMKIRQTTP